MAVVLANCIQLFFNLIVLIMKTSINNNLLISCMGNQVKRISLLITLLITVFSYSYSQKVDKDDPRVKKHDITNNLRANHKWKGMDDTNKIPVSTRNQFAEDFSQVQDVTWKVEPGFNEADFTMNDKSMMAFYSFDDELIGTGYYVDYADLPEKGKAKIAKDYADFVPEKAMYFEESDVDDQLMNFFGNFLQEEAYYVLLRNADKEIVVEVSENGDVSYFRRVKEM